MNAFFFLKFVLSTGRAIMKTLRVRETPTNGNLLLVDILLVRRDWVLPAAEILRTQCSSHLLQFLVNGERSEVLLTESFSDEVLEGGLSVFCIQFYRHIF